MMPKEKNQYILDKIIEFIENRNDELWKRIAFCDEYNMKMQKEALLLVDKEQKEIRYELRYGKYLGDEK